MTAFTALEFEIGAGRYAFDMRHVRGVLPLKDVTPLPCTPAFIAGIVNVRGRIVPVIDLAAFLGRPAQAHADLQRIILVDNGEVEVGVMAGIDVGVRTCDEEEAGREDVTVVDLAAFLSDPRLTVHDEPEFA